MKSVGEVSNIIIVKFQAEGGGDPKGNLLNATVSDASLVEIIGARLKTKE